MWLNARTLVHVILTYWTGKQAVKNIAKLDLTIIKTASYLHLLPPDWKGQLKQLDFDPCPYKKRGKAKARQIIREKGVNWAIERWAYSTLVGRI